MTRLTTRTGVWHVMTASMAHCSFSMSYWDAVTPSGRGWWSSWGTWHITKPHHQRRLGSWYLEFCALSCYNEYSFWKMDIEIMKHVSMHWKIICPVFSLSMLSFFTFKCERNNTLCELSATDQPGAVLPILPVSHSWMTQHLGLVPPG